MWTPSRSYLTLAICALAGLTGAFAADVPLADFDSISAPSSLSEQQAAAVADLQYHLRKILPGDWPIQHESPSGAILIEQQGDQGSDDQWSVEIKPGHIVLGGGKRGLGYAISLFLEDHCGVRWLWPGPTGEVIPANPALRLAAAKESGTPRFLRRQLMFGYGRYWTKEMRAQVDLWCQRTRQGNAMEANFGHAWSHVIPPEQYFAKHPEWFALVDGKRIPAQLCISNPALRDEFARRLDEMAGSSKLDILSVSANDGIGFCECKLCRAKGSTGDAYWDFVNDIALRFQKSHPEKALGSFAYTVGREPPAKIDRLPPNLYLSMTTYAPALVSEKGLDEYRKFVEGWKGKGVKIVMREYWGAHYWLDLPVLFPDQIAAEIKIAQSAGLIGLYGEAGKNFSTQAPNYYLLTHLAWDPEADEQKILDRYYDCFGPAAADVREYDNILGHAMLSFWQQNGYDGRYVALVNQYGSCFNADVLARAGAALERAEGKVQADPALAGRVAFLKIGLEYTRIMAPLLDLYRKLGQTGFPLESFEWEATARAGRRVVNSPDVDYSRDFFEERLKTPFNYTLAEKDAWLIQAWDLGQERIRLLNRVRNTPALDEKFIHKLYSSLSGLVVGRLAIRLQYLQLEKL